jgi:hypothetical protein
MSAIAINVSTEIVPPNRRDLCSKVRKSLAPKCVKSSQRWDKSAGQPDRPYQSTVSAQTLAHPRRAMQGAPGAVDCRGTFDLGSFGHAYSNANDFLPDLNAHIERAVIAKPD